MIIKYDYALETDELGGELLVAAHEPHQDGEKSHPDIIAVEWFKRVGRHNILVAIQGKRSTGAWADVEVKNIKYVIDEPQDMDVE